MRRLIRVKHLSLMPLCNGPPKSATRIERNLDVPVTPKPQATPIAVAPQPHSVSDIQLRADPPSVFNKKIGPQHAEMLDSLERKARDLCDDTRMQYELLLQRQEAQYERHLQALQHKLREVLSSSISLNEHRQALSDLSRLHDRDTIALTKAHEEEISALRLSCQQIANEHQLRRSRAFQDEKDLLLERMTQLEMDRNDALSRWRGEEVAVLSVRKDLDDTIHEKEIVEGKLKDSCQHIIALKSEVMKFDRRVKRMRAKLKAHTQANVAQQQKLDELTNAKAELSKQVCGLETEVAHVRAVYKTKGDELVDAKSALAAKDAEIAELQRALGESSAKESLLREFRDSERASFEQERLAWRAIQERSSVADAEVREQIATIRLERQSFEARCQLLEKDVARANAEHAHSEAQLLERLRALQTKYKSAKRRIARLEAAHAERQDEERVDQLLFGSSRRR